jgi:hypothetical protein
VSIIPAVSLCWFLVNSTRSQQGRGCRFASKAIICSASQSKHFLGDLAEHLPHSAHLQRAVRDPKTCTTADAGAGGGAKQMNVKTLFVATAETAQLQVGLLACFTSFRSSRSRGLQTRPRFLLHHRRDQPTTVFFFGGPAGQCGASRREFAGGGNKKESLLQILTKVSEKICIWGRVLG